MSKRALRVIDLDQTFGNVIKAPEDFRAVLMNTALGVLEQRISVSQANAVASLSVEIHKSIRQEFEMRCYVSKDVVLHAGRVLRVEDCSDED